MAKNENAYLFSSSLTQTNHNPNEYVLLVDTLTHKSEILPSLVNQPISFEWFLLPIVLICTLWGFWVKGCIDDYKKKKK